MTVPQLLATITLPAGLGERALADLAALWDHWAPRDPFERLLVTRLLQAAARLELSAQREPLEPDSLWLRHELAAERLFRQSLAALQKYRAEHPAEPAPPATLPAAPPPAAVTPPPAPEPVPAAAPTRAPGNASVRAGLLPGLLTLPARQAPRPPCRSAAALE